MNRSSFIISIGRLYQKISIVLSPFDRLMFALFGRKSAASPPVICILACPRSGSTLTYQLITTYINSTYLSNLQNLLFATPYFGIRISNRAISKHRSTFNSKYGFVAGLSGEAEGLKFWCYWTGQDLNENSTWDNKRAERLSARLANSIDNGKSLVTGYLGHVFCIEEMRNLFKNIRFVYLKRNLVDNAISILKANDTEVFSSKPDLTYSNNPLERVSQQLLRIHYLIFISRKEDYINLKFSDILNSPKRAMDKILKSFDCNDISVSKKSGHMNNFVPKESSPSSKYRRADVAQALELHLSTYSDQLFVNEMMRLIND